MNNNSRTNRLLLASFFCFLFVILLQQIHDYDIWFHLMFGREAVRLKAAPLQEFFVYTLKGSPAIYPEWGFGLLFYAAYVAGGFWGMSVLNAAIALIAVAVLVKASGEAGRNMPLTIVLVSVFVGMVSYRLVYRPEMVLYVALALVWLIFEDYRNSGRKRILFFIPLIAAVLNNIHPSALIVIAAVVFFGIESVFQRSRTPKDRLREALAFAALVTATVLCSSLNPNGLRQTVLPLLFSDQTGYLKDIVEFRPTIQTGMKWTFLAIAVLGGASVLSGTRRHAGEILMLLFLGYLAWKHVRNVALFAFAAYVPTAHAANRVYRYCADRFHGPTTGCMRTAAVSAIILLSVFTARSGVWGAGVREGVFPEETAVVLRQLRPQGNLFNYYATGGYLAWQLADAGYPVFIDGRHLWEDTSYEEYLKVYRASPEWRQIFAKYGITSVAIPPVEEDNGAYLPILVPLSEDPSWLLVGIEQAGMLLVKQGAVAGLDAGLPKKLIWEDVKRKAIAVVAENPGSPQALLSAGVACYKLRDFSGARTYLTRYLAVIPEDNPDASVVKKALHDMPQE